MKTSFRHQGVPYRSQWVDPTFARRIVEDQVDPCLDPGWPTSGFVDAEDYRFWSRRICGLACLQSVLEHWQYERRTTCELLSDALDWGAYVAHADGRVDGLLYAPFGRWLYSAFGLEVEILPRNPLEDLIGSVDSEAMVIASVSTEIRYPARENSRRGGHLVLIHGHDQVGVWFHNPSGATGTQSDVYLEHTEFSRFFARRGMVIRRQSQGPILLL